MKPTICLMCGKGFKPTGDEHVCQPCNDEVAEAESRINTPQPETRPPAEPANLEEWLWYVRRYETGIYVREQANGKWGNMSLADLPPDRWAHHVARWLDAGALPVRIREESELNETNNNERDKQTT